MRIIILGVTKLEAQEKLKTLFPRFAYRKNVDFVVLANGDEIYAKTLSDSFRGFRYDKAIVSNLIEKSIVYLIVEPMLITSCLPIKKRLIFY